MSFAFSHECTFMPSFAAYSWIFYFIEKILDSFLTIWSSCFFANFLFTIFITDTDRNGAFGPCKCLLMTICKLMEILNFLWYFTFIREVDCWAVLLVACLFLRWIYSSSSFLKSWFLKLLTMDPINLIISFCFAPMNCLISQLLKHLCLCHFVFREPELCFLGWISISSCLFLFFFYYWASPNNI